MLNEALLQYVVEQVTRMNNRLDMLNARLDYLEARIERVEDQFEYTDPPELVDDYSDIDDEISVPSPLVGQLTNNLNLNNSPAECTPEPSVTMSPTDLVLVCSATAPTVQSVDDKSAIGYNQCFRVNELTLLAGFAPHITAQTLENVTGYKLWKPGLCLS